MMDNMQLCNANQPLAPLKCPMLQRDRSPPPQQQNLDYSPTTPVIPNKLANVLEGHPNAHFLEQGFSEGFHIPHVCLQIPWKAKNHASAVQHLKFLSQYIDAEFEAGRLMGLFQVSPHPDSVCSPLGVIQKKEPGTFRVIHNLSFPKGSAVNDMLPNDLSSVSYEDFDHVVSLAVKQGANSLISQMILSQHFESPPYIQIQYLFGIVYIYICISYG